MSHRHPFLRFRLTVATGIRFSQIVLVTVALVCLAFSHGLTDRNQTTYESLRP